MALVKKRRNITRCSMRFKKVSKKSYDFWRHLPKLLYSSYCHWRFNQCWKLCWRIHWWFRAYTINERNLWPFSIGLNASWCKFAHCEINNRLLIKLLSNPEELASSPDMNQIENLWSILKDKVYELSPKTENELIDIIFETWEKLDVHWIRRLIDSMPSRL